MIIIILWLRSKRMFFQFPVVNFFNFAETKTKHTPRALKMMKIALTVVIISFFGAFGKDRKIADDFILATPCYPRCKRELDECKEFHKCSGRRQSKRGVPGILHGLVLQLYEMLNIRDIMLILSFFLINSIEQSYIVQPANKLMSFLIFSPFLKIFFCLGLVQMIS